MHNWANVDNCINILYIRRLKVLKYLLYIMLKCVNVLAILVFCLFSQEKESLTLSGDIFGRLKTREQPYIVLEPLRVPQSSLLIIDEGVKICFAENTGLKVLGEIKINGTITNRVKLSSLASMVKSGEPLFWEGITIDSTGRGFIYNCDVEYAKLGVKGLEENSRIEGVTFLNCLREKEIKVYPIKPPSVNSYFSSKEIRKYLIVSCAVSVPLAGYFYYAAKQNVKAANKSTIISDYDRYGSQAKYAYGVANVFAVIAVGAGVGIVFTF